MVKILSFINVPKDVEGCLTNKYYPNIKKSVKKCSSPKERHLIQLHSDKYKLKETFKRPNNQPQKS
jgi:hypothetical protein